MSPASQAAGAETAPAKIRLYELVLGNGRSASPFVWRIRYALAHKGIAFECVPLGFTEIAQAFGGRFKTVPVIERGDTMLAESWDIAEYIDREFPAGPALFSSAAEREMVRLTDAWFSAEVMRKLFRVYVLDIHNAARPEDRPYFRQSREARLKGATLEAMHRRSCGPTADDSRIIGPASLTTLACSLSRRRRAELRRLHRARGVPVGCEREYPAVAGAKRRGAARLARPGIRPVRRIGTRPEKPAAVRIADLCRFGRLEVPGAQFAALENEGELTPIVDEMLRTLRADPAYDERI